MLKRKIEKAIMHWIETSEKALLIYGLRQAGIWGVQKGAKE